MSSKPTSGQLNFRIARHPFAIADWTLAKSPANATRLLESMPCAHASYAASAQQPHVRRLPTFPIRPTQGSRTITDVSLAGRVAVVTGATKGVGRGIGRELARHGARVFATGRSAPDHERLDEKITGIRCDHTIDNQVEAAFKLIVREANAIDILVNNVWGGYERMVEDGNFTWPKPFWEQPLWRWNAMFSAGVRAHYHASQLAAPSMITQRRGLIVNISFLAAPQHSRNVSYGVSPE